MFFIPKEDLNYAVQGLSCHEEVFKNKTFLITGGTGFIGKWLVATLHQLNSENNFNIKPGTHPIVPVMFFDAKTAVAISDILMQKNIYAVAFSYPVVPKNEARIRIQISAAHDIQQLDHAVHAFVEARKIVLGE